MSKKQEKRVFLTPKEAMALLPEGEEIHVFHNPNGAMLIGFDVSRERIKKAIKNAKTREIGGEECVSMKHGLVVIPKYAKYQKDIWFINHDEKAMKKYE